MPAVSATASASDAGSDIRDYEWILNWSFPFAGRASDIVPVMPSVTAEIAPADEPHARRARDIVLGKKDIRFVERMAGDKRSSRNIVAAWIDDRIKILPAN